MEIYNILSCYVDYVHKTTRHGMVATDIHIYNLSKFPDFSLIKVKFPRSHKYKMPVIIAVLSTHSSLMSFQLFPDLEEFFSLRIS